MSDEKKIAFAGTECCGSDGIHRVGADYLVHEKVVEVVAFFSPRVAVLCSIDVEAQETLSNE